MQHHFSILQLMERIQLADVNKNKISRFRIYYCLNDLYRELL